MICQIMNKLPDGEGRDEREKERKRGAREISSLSSFYAARAMLLLCLAMIAVLTRALYFV